MMIMILTTKLHLFITNIDNVDSYDGNYNKCYHHNPNNHIINKDIDGNNEIDKDTD